jgi:hypothetical protein
MGKEIVYFFAPSPISWKRKRILPLSLSAECVAFYNILPVHSVIGFYGKSSFRTATTATPPT